MSRPRTITFASAQRRWDNLTPEDVYGPDDPYEDEEEQDDEEGDDNDAQ